MTKELCQLPSVSRPDALAPAVFLDRDGTLMEDVDYCRDPADVRMFPGARAALARLKAAGFRLVIVTNQSGIGRGYFSEKDYRRVQAEFLRRLGDGLIDATYYCPDAPDAPFDRRKPAPGMIFEAARDLRLDLRRSFMVGDKAADVECGHNAGLAGSVLVLTGKGAAEREGCGAEFVTEGMEGAAGWILRSADLRR